MRRIDPGGHPSAGARRPVLKAHHLTPVPPERGRWHAPVGSRARFLASVLAGVTWAGLAAWVSLGWIAELGRWITFPLAAVTIAGVAIVPACLNAQLLASLALDRPRRLRFLHRYPALTLLVATRDDEDRIEETLTYALRSDYPGGLAVLVADDGSSDRTREIARRIASRDRRLHLLELGRAGKPQAQNAALALVATPLVATIEAGTLLMPYALRRAVARLLSSPKGTVAVTGAVLVRNSRESLLTRIQEWEYFLGVSSVQRRQGLLRGSVVAQGALSVHETAALRRAGGWPERIRPDLALRLALLRGGGVTTFEPTAIAFTSAPASLDSFVRQRQRWAQGLVESLRDHGRACVGRRGPQRRTIAVTLLSLLFDGAYTLAALPGIALAAHGSFAIIGPIAAAVLPVGVTTALLMLVRQRREWRRVGLRIRWNPLGFILYLLAYQLLLSPVSFVGYVREVVRARRVA